MAESTINALSHVNVVLGGSAAVVGTGFGFDIDAPGRTGRSAQFARDATFLPRRVSAQSMFSPEVRTQRPFFVRVVYRPLK